MADILFMVNVAYFCRHRVGNTEGNKNPQSEYFLAPPTNITSHVETHAHHATNQTGQKCFLEWNM